MRKILLPVHGDEGQVARIRAALDIAHVLGGHVECLYVGPLTRAAPKGSRDSGGEIILADDRPRNAVFRNQFEQLFAGNGVPWSWAEADEPSFRALADKAELADLIIIPSAQSEGRDDLRILASKVSRKIGRLVMAIPRGSSGMDLRGTALIAWEGSQDADSALRGAVPFLRQASNVVLLEIDVDGRHSAASAEDYLAHHEIEPRVEPLTYAKRRPTVSAILTRAHEVHASYVVIGAFHDSLATELVFGGVTRSMLSESNLPLLIAH